MTETMRPCGVPARNSRPFSFDDLADALEWAGLRSVDSIAERIGRRPEEIDTALFLLGVDVGLSCPDLVWCDECAAWRTKVNRFGRCPVCQARENIRAEKARCSDALESMDKERRAVYERREAARHAPIAGPTPRPVLTVPEEATRRERAALEAFQAAAVEAWELKALKREYDAEKQRLKRIRKAMGANPRINAKAASESARDGA